MADREKRTEAAVNGFMTQAARATASIVGVREEVPFSRFRQRVRRVKPSELLPALAVLSNATVDMTLASSIYASAPPWAIALVARESILWGNEFRGELRPQRDLAVIFNSHNNLIVEEHEDLLAILTRYAYEQFPYQESIYEELSRTHALLVDGLHQVPLESLSEESWQRVLGAPIGQQVGATFFLQVAANNNAGWFDPVWLDRNDMQDVYDYWPREVIERRVRQLSCTFEEFKADYEAAPKPPQGFERYAWNPLRSRPFIHMPDGRLLAPQPRLILPTVTPGALYYPAIRALGSAFARDLGRLTEWYVGEQLRTLTPAPNLVGEITYARGQRKSIDWFLVLPRVVVMIEVKSARFGLLDRASPPGQNPGATRLNKAITQLTTSSDALDVHTHEFAPIPTDRRRIGIIVTGEPHYLANSPWMREHLDNTPFPVLVASLREIERLVCLPLAQVERQLLAVADDPERQTWSLGTAITIPDDLPENPILRRAWNSYPWLDEQVAVL